MALNVITLLQENFPACKKCKTYSVFVISELDFLSNPTKMAINYNPHNNSLFLLLQDYFPAVANWLKLRFHICTFFRMVSCVALCALYISPSIFWYCFDSRLLLYQTFSYPSPSLSPSLSLTLPLFLLLCLSLYLSYCLSTYITAYHTTLYLYFFPSFTTSLYHSLSLFLCLSTPFGLNKTR